MKAVALSTAATAVAPTAGEVNAAVRIVAPVPASPAGPAPLTRLPSGATVPGGWLAAGSGGLLVRSSVPTPTAAQLNQPTGSTYTHWPMAKPASLSTVAVPLASAAGTVNGAASLVKPMPGSPFSPPPVTTAPIGAWLPGGRLPGEPSLRTMSVPGARAATFWTRNQPVSW